MIVVIVQKYASGLARAGTHANMRYFCCCRTLRLRIYYIIFSASGFYRFASSPARHRVGDPISTARYDRVLMHYKDRYLYIRTTAAAAAAAGPPTRMCSLHIIIWYYEQEESHMRVILLLLLMLSSSRQPAAYKI